MRKHELYTDYHDYFEYFGNNEIERIRKQGEKTIRHDWIIFTLLMRQWNFSTISAVSSWAIMPENILSSVQTLTSRDLRLFLKFPQRHHFLQGKYGQTVDIRTFGLTN